MKTIASFTQDGAYGFPYTVAVTENLGRLYGSVSGFRWSNNEGGMEHCCRELDKQEADFIGNLIERTKAGTYLAADVGLFIIEA